MMLDIKRFYYAPDVNCPECGQQLMGKYDYLSYPEVKLNVLIVT
jgi:hypothetical protein